MVVEGLLYTKEHEWIKLEGKTVVVGITDYAQQMLGEITFVETPAVGREFEQNSEMAVVESSKAASDVYSPVQGKVTEVNSKLEAEPELINQDCYGAGWICRMDVAGDVPTEELMDAKQYEEYLRGL